MVTSPDVLVPGSGSADKAQYSLYGQIADRPLVREGVPQEETLKCLEIISMEEKEKLVVVPRWWPDNRNRLTD
jgi:hypothetical protein